MATGRSNKLVGQVGEFLVCAELGRRGLIATPFAGNVPRFDVIATDERCRSVPIQVKTNGGSGSWQFSGKKHLRIRFDARSGRQRVLGIPRVADPDTICVLVWLGHQRGVKDRFFVLTRAELLQVMRDDYRAYLRKHHGVRPQNPKSTFVAIRIPRIAAYEDKWGLIERQLAQSGRGGATRRLQ